MTFYFAWGEKDEKFCPQTHTRQDEDIFYFELHHHEGSAARVKINIKNPFLTQQPSPRTKTVLLFPQNWKQVKSFVCLKGV